MSNMAASQPPVGPDEQAALWCIRFADGHLNGAEQNEFDLWLAADPAHGRAFEEAVAIWQGIDMVADTPEMIGFRAEAVEGLRRVNARRWAPDLSRRWRWSGALAACLALFLLVGTWLLNDPTRSYETGIGERRVVMLEDGTRLTLDGATRVDVRMDRDQRRLKLVAGRALFDVAHDPLRPLSVLARNRLTIATGTSFSVELLPRQMRVVLYEGKVEVLAQAAGPHRLLGPGDSSGGTVIAALVPGHELVASTEGRATRIDATEATRSQTWETGVLSFDGEPLAIAVERMNRDAKNKLVIADASIADFPISGVFTAGDVEAFVEGASALYPIAVVREPGQLVLKRETGVKKIPDNR